MEKVWEALARYHGVDWVGICFSMLSTHYLAKKRKHGFLLGMAGNIAFVVFGVLAESAANVVANGIYFFLNARGFFKWKAKPPKNQE
ncbi:MAG TPA: nicotinamide mononucleotide transporter [Verrucomicrobiae bacterium]|nr:nicotinamide mononucleotide transporter [Verrucomicrobiae bacterium]